MFAAVCTQYGPAARALTVLRDLPPPVISDPHQVLVRVQFTAVNPADAKQRSGNLRSIVSHRFPWIVGQDLAGSVVVVGGAVTRFRVGDAVVGSTAPRNGCAAEFAVAHEDELARMPATLSGERAAAIPTGYCTAYKGLFQQGIRNLEWKAGGGHEDGPSVLIIGASGSVGSAALHLAVRASTAASVVAICGPQNVEFCKSLGAARVLAHSSDYTSELSNQTFDLILDCGGGDDYYHRLRPFLKPKTGRYVTCVGPVRHGGSEPITVRTLVSTATTLVPRLVGNCLLWGSWNPRYGIYLDFSTEPLDRILQCHEILFTDRERPMPRLDPRSPLSLADICAAHEQVETGRSQGKVVIRVVDNDSDSPIEKDLR